jgi:thiol:disulfide interchange protein DsbA
MKNIQLKSRNLFIFSSLLFLLSACSTPKHGLEEASLNPTEYKQNHHYRLINPALTVETNENRIEVVEMFFYACPHCNDLDSKILPWLDDKKDIVDFKRIPAILGPTWADQARAYYVAEQLGIIGTIHPALLKAIHKDKRKFYNEYSVMEFFVEQGVDKQLFIDAYNSPQVAEKVNYARVMTVKYGLRGVPAIIVNGKYKTAPFYMGSQEKILDIVDYLIAKERSLLSK